MRSKQHLEAIARWLTALMIWFTSFNVMIYNYHFLDRFMFQAMGQPPIVNWIATPMGFGQLHLPSFLLGGTVAAWAIASWAMAGGLIELMTWLLYNPEWGLDRLNNPEVNE